MNNLDKYISIHTELQNMVNNNILTLENANIINDMAYNKYMIEMKTKEEYGERSFKKKYKFIPDKPGARTGTIEVNGKRQPVDFGHSTMVTATGIDGRTTEVPRQTSANLVDTEGKIVLNKNYFKLKGSNKNERRDAVLQHEVGHTRLHGINPKSKALDRSKMTPSATKSSLKTMIKNQGIDPNSLDKNSWKELKKTINYKKSKKKIIKNSTEEDRKLRKEGIKQASKYVYKNVPHSSTNEIEADRYAANRTSKRAVKHGIKEMGKRETKDIINKLYLPKEYYDDKTIKKVKSNIRSNNQKDLNSRSRSLKDKKLRDNHSYK